MNEMLRVMLLEMLQGYVKMSMFATQKLLLTQRRPNQWQIDNAFSGMFQNVPQFAMQCQQPPMDVNKPSQEIGQLQKLIDQLAKNAPQQTTQQAPAQGAQATWDGTQWVMNP